VAGHLVRLKLALLRGGLASLGVKGKVAFGVAYVFSVALGLSLGGLMVALRGAPARDFADVTHLAFGLMFLAWVFGPVLTVASENTLEVDRLALFPISGRDLMTGLLLASMVGFGGLVTVLVLLGALAGTAPVSPAALVTVAAVVVQFALCVAASRLVSTALSAATRKRRWRDLALTIAPMSFFVLNLAMQRRQGSPVPVRLLELLPSGLASNAVVAAHDERAGLGVGLVVAGAIVVAVLLWLWWRAIGRVLTTAVESGGPARSGPASRVGANPLFPRWAPWLPAGRVGAVAAKELRLQWREPRRRTGVISTAFFALLPLVSMRGAVGAGHGLVLFALFPAVMFGIGALNQYGFDGPRFWMHVAAGDDPRSDLLGKNLECVIVAVPLVLVEAVGLALMSHGWEYVLPALALTVLTLGLALGIGNVMSVAFPIALPESSTNMWASNSSQSMQMMLPALGSMIGFAVVLVPLVLVALARAGSGAMAAVMAAEVVVAWLVWRAGLGLAVRRSADRQPELLAELSQTR
jgi:ABC-2 type transport system permease protein